MGLSSSTSTRRASIAWALEDNPSDAQVGPRGGRVRENRPGWGWNRTGYAWAEPTPIPVSRFVMDSLAQSLVSEVSKPFL